MPNQEEIKNDVDLLKKEAELNNFPLKDIEQSNYKNFYNILNEIIQLKKHENKIMTCGSVISDKEQYWLSLEKSDEISFFSGYADLVSDGKSVFYYLESSCLKLADSHKIIVFQQNKSCLELMKLSIKAECIIITKDEIRTLIYYGFNVTSIENRLWSSYTDCLHKDKQLEIENFLDDVLKTDLSNVFEYITFAEFELSLDKIGTTIVYFLDDNYKESKQNENERDIVFDFSDMAHKKILKNFLKTHDGAILAKGNTIFREQVRLNSTGNETDPNHNGTRHNSAMNFAIENTNTVVICISEDGPITLYYKNQTPYELQFTYTQKSTKIKNTNFQDNSKILCFMAPKSKVAEHIPVLNLDDEAEDQFQYDFSGLKELAEERGDIYDENWTDKICSRCKKTFAIKITRISGWNDREEYNCPYCGEEYLEHCFDVQVKKIKDENNKEIK